MSQPSRCTLTAPRLARGRMADNEHAYRAASPLCTPVYKRWKNPKKSLPVASLCADLEDLGGDR